jgi:hypothetical protein
VVAEPVVARGRDGREGVVKMGGGRLEPSSLKLNVGVVSGSISSSESGLRTI